MYLPRFSGSGYSHGKMLRWARTHFAWTTTILITFVVVIDQFLKNWVATQAINYSSSWFAVAPHFNEGILGGFLSDLHPWIIRIFFSVLFGFIAMLTLLALYFLRHKEIWRLKYGIVFYVSGVLGNVWDRATTGKITDFLSVNLPLLRHYAFNFADLVLIIGLFLTIYSLVADYRRIWFDQNQRRSLIIEARFQFGFSTFLIFMAAMNASIVAIYSFTFLKVYLDGQTTAPPSSELIRDYLIGMAVIEIGFLLISLGVGLIFSHRMAGPIYAFEKYIDRLFAAKSGHSIAPFQLRNMDYFKSLEKTAAQIADQIQKTK